MISERMRGSERAQRWLCRACLGLPLIMLALHLLCWLRWGMDLPFVDDWRAYDEGQATSFALARLFAATNNTIAPLGLALDTLAQRWLGGNALPYQSLSLLLVLGGLLWLQWRLLGWALRQRLWQALAFALTFFMLQPRTYWGEQSLAYHQALPLLALLGATWWNFAAGGAQRLAPVWRMAGVGVLGLAAGLSYVSGAVAALVMGLAWQGLAYAAAGGAALRQCARQGGWPLALAGVGTLGLQLWLTRGPQASAAAHPSVLTGPQEPAFWSFYAGLLGRASGQGFAALWLELLWVLGWALALLLAGGWALTRLRAAGHAGVRRTAFALLPLLAVALAYMGLVSLGRAGLRPEGVTDMAQVFRLAYGRFHFFWLTLLFPWLAALAAWRLRHRAFVALAAGGAALLCLAAPRGVFDIGGYYRETSALRTQELRCIVRHLGSAQPPDCAGFRLLRIQDVNRLHAYAQAIGAAFVRQLPLVEREGFGRTLLYATPEQGRWVQAQPLADGWRQGIGDAQWHLSVPGAGACRTLGVQLVFDARQAGVAQLFFQPRGQPGFSETHAVRKPYDPAVEADAAAPMLLEFLLEQPAGFGDGLRVDMADGLAQFRVHSLRAACWQAL